MRSYSSSPGWPGSWSLGADDLGYPAGRADVAENVAAVDTDVSRETSGVPVTVDESTRAGVETTAAAIPQEQAIASDNVMARSVGPKRRKVTLKELNTPVSRETSKGWPQPAETRIIVIANQKGGVGKTTTCVNIAAAMAQQHLRVLVVDLDPQGNASTALGVDHEQGTPGTYEVLINGASVGEHVKTSPESENLKVLPSTIDLAAAEIELVSTVARENCLLKAIRTYLRDNPTDYVFFDCPPSLGLLTLNALVAAQEILVPIQCEYYALEGVTQLMRTINLVKGEINDDLKLSTVVLTMYDGRTRLAAQVADEVRKHFAHETVRDVIPRSVRISEAPSYGRTVVTYDPSSSGARSYIGVAEEIARRGPVKEKS